MRIKKVYIFFIWSHTHFQQIQNFLSFRLHGFSVLPPEALPSGEQNGGEAVMKENYFQRKAILVEKRLRRPLNSRYGLRSSEVSRSLKKIPPFRKNRAKVIDIAAFRLYRQSAEIVSWSTQGACLKGAKTFSFRCAEFVSFFASEKQSKQYLSILIRRAIVRSFERTAHG